MVSLENIVAAISREMDYQDSKWGNPLERPHDVPGWMLIMRGELEEAEKGWQKGTDEDALEEILQVVAVGIQCLRQHGIIERITN